MKNLRRNEMDKKGILKDLIIIELASVLAGPHVGAFFTELGARVIKIENIFTDGDVTRKWKLPTESADEDISSYFSCVNWGKESIGLNLKTEEGLQIIYNLVKKADIIIVNYKPGDAEKLKVDYKTFKDLNPKIIYGHITGYGLDVPRAGFDAIIQSESGFTNINGEPKGPPIKLPVALMDILTAHQLKEAILLALLKLEKTGEGSLVSASLIQSGIASLANQGTNWLVGNSIPKRTGSDHPNIVPYGTIFKTWDDDEIVIAIGSDEQFSKLMKILGKPEIADDERFKTNHDRVKNRDRLNSILEIIIKDWKKNNLMKALCAETIPAGTVNNIKEVFELKQAKEMILTGNVNEEEEEIKGCRTNAFKFDDEDRFENISPPPHYGEHTKKILSEFLGLDEEKIKLLYEKDVIG